MKNKNNMNFIFSVLCFIVAVGFSILYALSGNETIRFFAAIGFTACTVVFLKMFFAFLRDIRFGKKLFAPLRKLFAKLYKKLYLGLGGKDDDKVYLEGKKDEFQIKFETFRAGKKTVGKKAAPRLPKYSSLKTDKERVRHIYTVFLKKKAERGYGIKPTLTPDEISADFAGNEKAQMLFSAYPAARYGAENEPCDADISKLEELI